MLDYTKFSFKKLTICSIAMLIFCFFANDLQAQSEREKSETENPTPLERSLIENPSVILDHNTPSSRTSSSQHVLHEENKNAIIKKENSVGGEKKKMETVPSTMSFNIFLYIVDKFKAD